MAGIPVEQVPCAGTVPATLPALEYPYIDPTTGSAVEVSDDVFFEETDAQYLADHDGVALDMVVPPTTTPNSSTWLTDPTQVVLTTPLP